MARMMKARVLFHIICAPQKSSTDQVKNAIMIGKKLRERVLEKIIIFQNNKNTEISKLFF